MPRLFVYDKLIVLEIKHVLMILLLTADGIRFSRQYSIRDCDSSRRLTSLGHGWYFRPVRQGLPVAGQEEEVRD